jgi:phosphatidylglycerol:prolipoprotein diacylglycerol transferase
VFPYIESDHWRVRPFAMLVVIAIATGYLIGLKRLTRQGIARERFSEVALSVTLGGLLGAHLLKLVYVPGAFVSALRHPLVFLAIGNGQASFGAFVGALVSGLIFFWRRSISVNQWFIYSDAGAFAVPFAWAIGRLGCYLVHDHPGLRTSSWLGVQYRGGNRFDLGLLEMLFLLLLGCAFLLLDLRKWPRGFYCTAFLLCYGAFRWNLDQLHVDPPRYGRWSVDQIASSAMIVAGIACVIEMRRLKERHVPE